MHCFSNILNDDYIFLLTDDTGMLQHSKFSLPDPEHGYVTEDNARALIMALMLYEKYKKKKYLNLVYRYASFLLNAQNENGRFKNFMRYDRKWLEEEGTEDCFGRCLWALGFALSNLHTPNGVKQGLLYMLNRAMPHVTVLNSPRSKAYCIIGLAHLEGGNISRLIFETAQTLCRQYDEYRDGEWKWFENVLTYGNYVLPWSLIKAYRVTGENKFLEVAIESLEFLNGITFRKEYFKPIGCHGWLAKGATPAEFDEQPVEACEGFLTCLEAYEATNQRSYLQKAIKCYEWYAGFNSKGVCLIDTECGGCYDGLTKEGINMNMGAESLISYVISYIKISDFIQTAHR